MDIAIAPEIMARYRRSMRSRHLSHLFHRLFLLLVLALLVACRPAVRPTPGPAVSTQQILVLPDDGTGQVIELIQKAQKSIRFKIYLLTDDEMTAALVRAANRGVDVRVILEQNPTGGGESNRATFDKLQQNGVSIHWAPARYRLTHEKSLLIDDQRVLVGTFNYTPSSFKRNREYGVLIDDPALVREIAAIFDADWSDQPYEHSPSPTLVLSPLNSRQQIEGLIDSAQQTLWLEQASLLDDAVAERLAASATRGVKVYFIGPLRTGEDDLSLPNYRRLQQAGAEVRRLENPLVHAKVILADNRRALLGSINLTYASMELNRELGLLTEDAAIIRRLQQTLQGDWGRAAAVVEAPTGAISWQEAGKYIGSKVTVEGDIVRTYNSGKVIFLNFSQDYRNTLSLVIFAASASQFPAPPEDYYLNQRVRATGQVKMYQNAPEIVIESPDQIELLSTSTRSTDLAPVRSGAGVASPPPAPPTTLSWEQAGDYLGQNVTVEGHVVRTYDSGKVTFLNFNENWRGTFSVVIFASDYDKFPQPPAELFQGQTVRVRGKVKEYQGAPEMVVESPADIEIVTVQKTETPGVESTPTPTPPSPPMSVISWKDAGAHLGQTITIEGRIVDTHDTGAITFLNFSSSRDQFVAVVFAEDYGAFPQPPAELYKGKKIWLTGKVTEHQGTPQVVVKSPQQIEVFP